MTQMTVKDLDQLSLDYDNINRCKIHKINNV